VVAGRGFQDAGEGAALPMDSVLVTRGTADAIPIWFVTAATYPDIRARFDAGVRAFADAAGFEPKAGRQLLLPGNNGLRLRSGAFRTSSMARRRRRLAVAVVGLP
jgi:hypothetical protein